MADNSQFKIAAMNLNISLQVAFTQWKTATGFYADKDEFVLFWTDSEKATKFPAPLGIDEIEPIVKAWLEHTADYGKTPNIDGSSSQSQTVENHNWGHIDGYGYQAFARIIPTWALHGK